MQKAILLFIVSILAIQAQAADTCKAMIKANFEVKDVCEGSEALFTNTSASDPNESTYLWDFGDGNTNNQMNKKYVYDSAGSYQVKLIVTLKNGCSDTIIKNINISPLPKTCNFEIVCDSNISLSTYKFIPTGGTMLGNTYTWLTGDGNTVISASTGGSYTYKGNRRYCVTMIASNNYGCEYSLTKCFDLTTNINDVTSSNNTIVIFPNPSSHVFNLKLNASIKNLMVVQIYNSIGELIKTVISENNHASFDLTDYPMGLYMVKVMADNQIATQQIIYK